MRSKKERGSNRPARAGIPRGTRRERPPRALALLILLASGCLGSERLDAEPSDAGTDALGLSVYDWSGRPTPENAIARHPSIDIEVGTRVDGSSEPALLFAGPMDEALLEDLMKAPMKGASAERAVACHVRYLPARISLVPGSVLEPGSTYTVALAGWARTEHGREVNRADAVFYRELVVSRHPDAGARVTGSWPADGTAGVAPNLLLAALQFDGEIEGEQEGVWLQDPQGLSVPARIRREHCGSLGWEGGSCVLIEPAGWLAGGARYQIVVGSELRDSRGSPVGPWSAWFSTATGVDSRPAGPLPLACALDEREMGSACALVDESSVTLRLAFDEPVRLSLGATGDESSRVAYRGEAELVISGLQPDEVVKLSLSALDAAGNQSGQQLLLRTEADLPRLSITEVRADPRGPEPYQELVEVVNYGHTPIDLEGFSLSDDPYAEGDEVMASVTAHPGARVLLAADAFDPDEQRDDLPPAGATIVRLGKSLAGSGLSNSGEPLYLRDPRGRRISAAPASPRPRPGVCLVRVTDDMRDGSVGSFDYDRDNRCTPGY